MVDCLKCVNSACCKLDVEVDRLEFQRFKALRLDKYFETRADIFIKKEPRYTEQKETLNKMYKDNFATLKKGNDGLCVLLDKQSMKCTIYDDRPKVCKDYTTNRCAKIRILKY
jgi:Fe-S-cluster containining protein